MSEDYALRHPDLSLRAVRALDRFHDGMIMRGDLPADVFALIHDLAYDHDGRDRETYKHRAQRILRAKGAKAAGK